MITLLWIDVIREVQVLSKMLGGKKVFGIPRGGMIIAGLLSYLGCELLTYPPMRKCMLAAEAESVVIVDDIADSGETLAEWSEAGFKTAALFVRGKCILDPTFVVNTIDEDDYIMFPYEDPVKAKELEENGVYKEHR